MWGRLRLHNGNRIYNRKWQWHSGLIIFITEFRKCNHSQCEGNYIHQQEGSVIWNSYISCIYHEMAVSMAIGAVVVCVCVCVCESLGACLHVCITSYLKQYNRKWVCYEWSICQIKGCLRIKLLMRLFLFSLFFQKELRHFSWNVCIYPPWSMTCLGCTHQTSANKLTLRQSGGCSEENNSKVDKGRERED